MYYAWPGNVQTYILLVGPGGLNVDAPFRARAMLTPTTPAETGGAVQRQCVLGDDDAAEKRMTEGSGVTCVIPKGTPL